MAKNPVMFVVEVGSLLVTVLFRLRFCWGAPGRREFDIELIVWSWFTVLFANFAEDLRGKYRSCGDDRACDPIPVPERVRTDFLWQRSPFLLYGGGGSGLHRDTWDRLHPAILDGLATTASITPPYRRCPQPAHRGRLRLIRSPHYSARECRTGTRK